MAENIENTKTLRQLAKDVAQKYRHVLEPGDITALKTAFAKLEIKEDNPTDPGVEIHPLRVALAAALVLSERVITDRSMGLALMIDTLNRLSDNSEPALTDLDDDTNYLVKRISDINALYPRLNGGRPDENFGRLLLSRAQDIRVIILLIVSRLALMRIVNHHPDALMVQNLAFEARYLYAPMAHRLGLYALKSELEDLSLKYSDREIFTAIARKLNETKTQREAYIANFIKPVREALEKAGLKFEIKGRTKSIFSIWNKLKKQRTDMEHIYDLFAIRIIIDTPIEREKKDCWLAFSVITDMFRPNPARMKDWISIPKANGYESLHTTVYGPDERWVEVQIRTVRMDEIAEKGLAAHWKYKGIKAEEGLDSWMGKIRDILETVENNPLELIKSQKMDVYDREVFVFTPKGDLYNLPEGSSVLDFAFHIHTGLGAKCTGARVNGKVCRINHKLRSGDTVEILSSASQQPKQDWLNFTVTSKARNKIRVALKEQEKGAVELGKELLQRRLKNRKLEIGDADLTKIIKRLGYKTITDFYEALSSNNLNVNDVIDSYLSVSEDAETPTRTTSAGEFILNTPDNDQLTTGKDKEDVLIIGTGNVKGMNFKTAKCCNPIPGDDVFGFISAEGVIKIHRTDCPNAANIRARYPYRMIKARWSDTFQGQPVVSLTIIGRDDIGIVTNISSLINRTTGVVLRGISIETHDTLFEGYIKISVNDNVTLNNLIKKIKNIKGVKDVKRN